ncbi:MAG: tetratricopeptide repeat protein [Armatimonadetes bacterium]|nr:tetratricopeptide repeat protein [Armatimonadota bacterium]
MKLPFLGLAALGAVLVLLNGCLYGRGPGGQAGNDAVRGDCSVATLTAAGQAYLDKSEPNDAFVVFKRAAAADPKNYDAQLGLAKACAELGEATLGLNAAETAASLKPKDAEPITTAGRISAGAWKLDEAERYFVEATKLAPAKADAWRDLGRVRLRRLALGVGSLADATTALEKARDLDAKNAEGHALLAEAYVRAPRTEAATQEYTRAVELEPSNADYPRNLAWLLIAQGKDLERARELAQKSDQIQLGDGDALVAAAVALLRQGEVDDALSELREAVGKASSNPDAYFYLAQAAARRGRPEDFEMAVSALQYMRGAGLTPRHASQAEMEALLGQIREGVKRLQIGPA